MSRAWLPWPAQRGCQKRSLTFFCVSRWQIRNKPLSAPKKPERAPFFLPSLPSLSGKPEFVVANGKETGNIGNGTDNNVEMSHIRRSGPDDFQTFFMHLLYECSENGDCAYFWPLQFTDISMFRTVAFAVFRIHLRKLLGVLMFSLCFPVLKWEHGYGTICHGMSCATSSCSVQFFL